MTEILNPSIREESISRLTMKKVWVEAPYNRKELDVYWLPRKFNRNRYPIGWHVYRCPAPKSTGPDVERITNIPVTVPLFFDTTVDLRLHQHYYYTVKEVFFDGSEIALDDPVTLYSYMGNQRKHTIVSMPRIFQEWKRRKTIILDNDAEEVDILIRRRAGERCPCFDGDYESPSDSTCLTCFGTGWVRGFILLPKVLIRVLSIDEVLRLQPTGLQFKSGPQAWNVDFPIFRNGDVIIRANMERSEVDSLRFNTHQGVLTEQSWDMKVLEVNNPVFNYVVPDSDKLSLTQ